MRVWHLLVGTDGAAALRFIGGCQAGRTSRWTIVPELVTCIRCAKAVGWVRTWWRPAIQRRDHSILARKDAHAIDCRRWDKELRAVEAIGDRRRKAIEDAIWTTTLQPFEATIADDIDRELAMVVLAS